MNLSRPQNNAGNSLSEGRYFLRAGSLSVILVGINGVANFLTRRTLSITLPEVDYGFLFGVLAFFQLFTAFLDLGLTQSATILIGKYESLDNHKRGKDVFSIFTVSRLLIFFIVVPVFIILSRWLARSYFGVPSGAPVVRYLAVWLGANIMLGCLYAVFDALKKPVARNLLMFFNYVGVLLLVKMLSGLGRLETGGVAAGYAIAFAVPGIGFFIYAALKLNYRVGFRFSGAKELFREFFSTSRWIAVSSSGLLILVSLDTVLLTQLSSYSSVATYNVALPVMQILLGFFNLIPQISTPLLISAWFKNSFKDLRKLNILVSLLPFAVIILIWPLIHFFLSDAIVLMFGEKYIGAVSPARILLIGVPCFIVAQIQQIILNISGRQKTAAIIVLSAIAFDVIANIILVPVFDMTGSAMSTASTYFFIMVLSFCAVIKVLRENMAEKR